MPSKETTDKLREYIAGDETDADKKPMTQQETDKLLSEEANVYRQVRRPSKKIKGKTDGA